MMDDFLAHASDDLATPLEHLQEIRSHTALCR